MNSFNAPWKIVDEVDRIVLLDCYENRILAWVNNPENLELLEYIVFLVNKDNE